MRWLSRPAVQAKQAIVFGETPVNPKACPFMNKIQAGSCSQYHLNAPASYSKSIKFWKTPVTDCGWGGRTDCVDYKAWNDAWAKITGQQLAVNVRAAGSPLRGARLPLSAEFWRRPWLRATG